eukprot:TRINITY_DN3155_c3_g1_i1.p1 TRINITY_DN3155_c3_g1~~TRINITY_DN3155_c3_g1_i1.p1  ORF type:complete len:167 (-),score=20.46 TRINITY_DN3155_c3_g1_i1:122-622(-)
MKEVIILSHLDKQLTFKLEDETFGIPVLRVKTIIGMMDYTKIPSTPSYVMGVINLRGKVIPIIDLRLKFSMEFKKYTERTCIIVVETEKDSTKKLMGIVVDDVSEVINISQENVESPPEYGLNIEEDFLHGIGKIKNKVIMLLKIDNILNTKEFKILDSIRREENV